jgi:hypothetical protein
MASNVPLRFYLDSVQGMYAARHWNHVPRVGDEVMLRDVDNKHEFTAYKVLRVVCCVV